MEHLRVMVVSESFLPQVNGVTNSVRRVLEHLEAAGHERHARGALRARRSTPGRRSIASAASRCRRTGSSRSGSPPGAPAPADVRPSHPTSCTWPRRRGSGHQAGEAARSLGIPVVAVYQTDLIGFAERYPFPGAAGAMRSLTRRVHGPPTAPWCRARRAGDQLASLGIGRLHRWGRGVDTDAVPPAPRSERAAPRAGRREQPRRVRRPARGGEGARAAGARAGPARHPAGRGRRRTRGAAVARRAPCARACSASATVRTSPRSWPPSTSSCTPGGPRRSASLPRRPSPPACPSWRRGRAGRSTWCTTASTGSSTRRATGRSCAAGSQAPAATGPLRSMWVDGRVAGVRDRSWTRAQRSARRPLPRCVAVRSSSRPRDRLSERRTSPPGSGAGRVPPGRRISRVSCGPRPGGGGQPAG